MASISSTRTYAFDEKSETVTIRDAGLKLSQNDILPNYHHVIYSDCVTLDGSIKNPGYNLTIFAGEIIVTDKAEIDVSGVAESGFAEGDAPHGTGHGERLVDGENGGNGKDAKPGGKGGRVNLYAFKTSGLSKLTIKSIGGQGGRGQDGGNGKDGGPVPERPMPPKPVWVKDKSGNGYVDLKGDHISSNKGHWQGSYSQIGKATGAELLVANSSSMGETGGHGGHAGLAGRPGDGGKGGRIEVWSLDQKPAKPAMKVGGGKAGPKAKHGKPGVATKGGLGAKYIYYSHLFAVRIGFSTLDNSTDKAAWQAQWVGTVHFNNLKVNKDFVTTVKGKKSLRLRSLPGSDGIDGGYDGRRGRAPAVKAAEKGADGSSAINRFEKPPKLTIPMLDYALLLYRCGTVAIANGDKDRARTTLRWLRFVTSGTCVTDQIRTLRDNADQQLATIDRGPDDRPLRVSFTDMKAAHTLVTSALDDLVEREERRDNYAKALRSSADRTAVLQQMIAEAQDQLAHLQGNSGDPGGIDFLAERELSFKRDILDLDRRLSVLGARLNGMPTELQDGIDAKIREKMAISFWDVMEMLGMMAGIAINFASATGSVVKLANTVKEAYSSSLGVETWGEILKEGIWSRSLSDIKDGVQAVAGTEEFKKAFGAAQKDTSAFAKSVIGFYGQFAAYEKLRQEQKKNIIDIDLDLIDLQARVLVFDTAKLEMKLQLNKLQFDLRKFIDEYEAAQKWVYLFTDYFDTISARFDILANLSDTQANLRELRFQYALTERNLTSAQDQLSRLRFETAGRATGEGGISFEADAAIAMQRGLDLVQEADRAYRMWTLENSNFKLPAKLTGSSLKSAYTKNLGAGILRKVARASKAANDKSRGASFDFSRYQTDQAAFEKTFYDGETNSWLFNLNVEMDLASDYYFERLLNVEAFLKGAKVAKRSSILCFIRHRGTSRFMHRNGDVLTALKIPHAIEFEYVPDGDGNKLKDGEITQRFESDEWMSRIHYSRYTNWELQLPKDYKPSKKSPTYNKELDLSGLQSIELKFDSYRQNRKTS